MVLQRADGPKVWLAKSLSVAATVSDEISIVLSAGVLIAQPTAAVRAKHNEWPLPAKAVL